MTTLTIRPSSLYVGNRYFGPNTTRNRRLLMADAKSNNWKVYYSYSGRNVDFSKRKMRRKRRTSSPQFGFRLPRGGFF